MSTKLLFRFSFAILLAFFSVSSGLAQGDSTYDWVGNTSDFYNASNWTSTNGAVQFDNNGFKVVYVSDVGMDPQIDSFVDWQPGVFDTYNNVNFTLNANFNVFFNDWLNGTVTINSGAIFTCRNIFRVGREGVGVVNINGGEFRVNNATDEFRSFFIGVLQNGNGTVNVNNGGIMESDRQIEIGTRDFYPTGVLNVNTGGQATAGAVTAIGPNGTINVNGGTLNTGNVLIVGDLFVDTPGNEGAVDVTPNVGDLNINDGSVVFNQNNLASPAFVVDTNGRIFIDEGSLILNNPGFDYTTEVNTLVNNGQIVAASGKSIAVSYDGAGQTTVTASPTASIQDLDANDYFNIYPNPTEGVIHLKPKNTFIGEPVIALYDMTGKKVYETKATYNLNTISIHPGENLNSGIYILEIDSSSGKLYSKIVVK
jgi:hypothetical protein